MIENRAIAAIEAGRNRGDNMFILDGPYVDDLILCDLYTGVLPLKEVLQRYFLRDKGFDYFVWFRNSDLKVYKGVSERFEETDELTAARLNPQSSSTNLRRPGSPNTGNDESAAPAEAAVAQAASSPEKAAFQKIVQFCQNHPEKQVAFFLENIEWTTGMFRSSNDEQLYIVEGVLTLHGCRNCDLVATISNAKMLEKYNFNIQNKNVQMLGSPTVEEIWKTYVRLYHRKYAEGGISYEDFRNLRLIAEAIGAGDRSLKEAIRVFERVMNEHKARLDPKDFDSAVDKHIQEKVNLDDVVLKKQKKDEIVQRIDDFISAEDVTKVRRGLTLTGPPGTGKTYLVKALANEKNCYFMSPSLADLKGEYVGHTSANVKRVFQQARANAPTIMFIDEADTVFHTRGAASGDSDSFAKDMVNQFLVEMDGLGTGQSKVFVIAATNRVEDMDPAIASRLGAAIEIPLPSRKQRRQLFLGQFQKRNVDRFIKQRFFDEFLDKTNGMSGRDIKNFVETMETIARVQMKKLEDYKEENEIESLFNQALNQHQADLISRLRADLHVEIKTPDTDSGYNSIIGNDQVKTTISEQVSMFDSAHRLRAKDYNIRPRRGVLLYGPPGNGKSRMAEAAASEHNLLFMKVTSDALVKDTRSGASHVLVDIFNGAVQLSELCSDQDGVLLFFDEFDALCGGYMDGHIRGTLLTQLDDPNTMRDPKTRVLFVAATNFYDALDKAAVRSGRIDDKVPMDNPNCTEGIQMIQQFVERNGHAEEIGESLATAAYKTYAKTRQDQQIAEFNKLQMSHGVDSPEITEQQLEMIRQASRPSASDLENYVARLLERSFLRLDMSGNRKLRVTAEDIKEVCGVTTLEEERCDA